MSSISESTTIALSDHRAVYNARCECLQGEGAKPQADKIRKGHRIENSYKGTL